MEILHRLIDAMEIQFSSSRTAMVCILEPNDDPIVPVVMERVAAIAGRSRTSLIAQRIEGNDSCLCGFVSTSQRAIQSKWNASVSFGIQLDNFSKSTMMEPSGQKQVRFSSTFSRAVQVPCDVLLVWSRN
jgi:hypothetical protein